jgi:hypothetical protein
MTMIKIAVGSRHAASIGSTVLQVAAIPADSATTSARLAAFTTRLVQATAWPA